jgi:hypothetical protein
VGSLGFKRKRVDGAPSTGDNVPVSDGDWRCPCGNLNFRRRVPLHYFLYDFVLCRQRWLQFSYLLSV